MPTWMIDATEEYDEWVGTLSEAAQEDVDAYIVLLEERGPSLGFPFTSSVNGAKHGHMRELRIQHKGKPIRILYAFDPRRYAVLLLGGHKTGKDRWYKENIPKADRLYDEHLKQIGGK